MSAVIIRIQGACEGKEPKIVSIVADHLVHMKIGMPSLKLPTDLPYLSVCR